MLSVATFVINKMSPFLGVCVWTRFSVLIPYICATVSIAILLKQVLSLIQQGFSSDLLDMVVPASSNPIVGRLSQEGACSKYRLSVLLGEWLRAHFNTQD